MKFHFNYLKYVLKHKYYVFIEGWKLKVPLWQLIIHDLSKFSRHEWFAYVDYFQKYPDRDKPQWVKERFDYAWNHHQKSNPHHFQYWILIYDDDDDSGELTKVRMPEKYLREMVADWRGASRVRNGYDDSLSYFLKRRERLRNSIHPDSFEKVEILLTGGKV